MNKFMGFQRVLSRRFCLERQRFLGFASAMWHGVHEQLMVFGETFVYPHSTRAYHKPITCMIAHTRYLFLMDRYRITIIICLSKLFYYFIVLCKQGFVCNHL